MKRTLSITLGAAILASLLPQTALAYIGPGVGAGALAAVMGVLGSIFLAIVAVLYYPIKRLLKRKKPASTGTSDKPAE